MIYMNTNMLPNCYDGWILNNNFWNGKKKILLSPRVANVH